MLLLPSSIFPVCAIFYFWVSFGSCFISRSIIAIGTNFDTQTTNDTTELHIL